jgi:cytochrome c biogenesis protein CcdA
MKALKVAIKTLLGSGALLLLLGAVIWIDYSELLVSLHIAFGVVFVFSLWTICAIAARSGVPAGTVAFATGWGVLVVVLGLTQEELLPGDRHWTIHVLHVAISMGAIWWGKRLAKLIVRTRSLDAGAPGPVSPSTIGSSSAR